jgi:hypothetical protein
MKDEDKAVSITPARLELITEVGPPDCPMSALPFIMLFISFTSELKEPKIPIFLFIAKKIASGDGFC